MFKRDLDGVACMVREADIGDDSGSAYCVLPRDDLRDAGSNDVGGAWMLLGKPQRGVEQFVQVGLRLRGSAVATWRFSVVGERSAMGRTRSGRSSPAEPGVAGSCACERARVPALLAVLVVRVREPRPQAGPAGRGTCAVVGPEEERGRGADLAPSLCSSQTLEQSWCGTVRSTNPFGMVLGLTSLPGSRRLARDGGEPGEGVSGGVTSGACRRR
jgi:hypothetical protein